MKRFLTLALAAAALTTFATARDASSDFKKFLVKFLPRLEKAFANHDATFFDKITTPDFTEVMMGQTFTKAQSMANMKQQLKTVESTKAKFKLLSAKAKGNTGISSSRGQFVMVMKPAKPGDTKHVMTMDMKTKETWVKTPAGWKLKRLEESGPSKMTMDGKPFDPSKMMPPPPPTKSGGN